MYEIMATKTFEEQFSNLEIKAKTGKLNKNNMILLKKYCHCIFKMIENPFDNSLGTSPYSVFTNWLTKANKKKTICYHSYLENHTSRARRIYWYFDNNKIKILGIANHPKSSKEMPKFNNLAKESILDKE